MGLLLESVGFELCAILLLVCYWLYKSYTSKYEYWEDKGVPHQKPTFPFGSMRDHVTGNEPLSLAYDKVYKQFNGERFCGVYEWFRPILVILDPELAKQILVSDFQFFMDRAAVDIGENETIQRNLFFIGGEEWRSMRRTFSPAFSSGKMKSMFPIIVNCSEQIQPYLEKCNQSLETVNVKDLLSRFTMDVIASCAFGAEIYSLKQEDSDFYKTGRSIFQYTRKSLMRHMCITLFPKIAALLNVQRMERKVRDTFTSLIKDTVEFREANDISRQDFLEVLINLRQKKSILDGTEEEEYVQEYLKSEGLTIDQMTAQSFIFFLAGFETASSTMTFCLYELAQHLDTQQRLCEEIHQVLQKHRGELTYQALQDMDYLDQVVNETLRMYASLGVLHRRCTSPYKIPGTDLVLEKGQKVYIPAYSYHHDPKYFPDPFRFDPERFNSENAPTRPSHLHLPFGTGPRHCIGMRFGLMQVKVGIITVIAQYKVDTTPETRTPVKYLNIGIVTQPDQPVLLKFSRRE